MQAMTLLLTTEGESRSMGGFCKLYHCDASNITGIIDGLEQKKLVSRQGHPSDRRIKVIRLEPAGRTLRAKILQKLADSSGFLFDPLNKSETREFVTIIEKLAANNRPI
jgi:DNA-binding MarR family transcriptional regulator